MKKFIVFSIVILMLTICAFAAEDTVYVSSTGDDTAAGTSTAPLETLYAACRALPYGGKIVICDDLTLNSFEFPASQGLITITSYDGENDYRQSGAKIALKGRISLKSAIKFENLNFVVSETGVNIICNGNYTCFSDGTDVAVTNEADYPNVAVGSIGLVGSDGGYLEIHSGTFSRVYCGLVGKNSAKASGNYTVEIHGGTFTKAIYLIGETEATGTTNAYIFGGNFNGGIVGAAIADISGNVNITIYGGEFSENAYLRPATNGVLSGSFIANILGGNMKKIYNVDQGSVTGEIKINLATGITLTSNPYHATALTNNDIAKITTANNTAITAAKDSKSPASTVNPLISRPNEYEGTADKATSFKKEIPGGDLNKDGIVSLIDVLHAFKCVCGEYNELADINEDKNVSVIDCLTILYSALSKQSPITEYTVTNAISDLALYGNAAVADNTFSEGYVFGTTDESTYTMYSKVRLNKNGVIGLYFGCDSATPITSSGYYFEVNTKDECLKVYNIVDSAYRLIAERKLHLLANEAEVKVTCGKTAENAVQLYFNDNPLITDYYFDFDLFLEPKGKAIGVYVENATATTPVVTAEEKSNESVYTNPIINNITDPEIYFEDGIYYIYGTKSGGASDGVQCFTTSDFVNFENRGIVLAKKDAYGDKSIVAANIVKQGDIYYMFYLQESSTLNINTTSFATASSPLGPFVSEEKVPLVSNSDIIGGQPFIDEDGTIYLVYTRTTGGNKTHVAKVNLADGKAELDLSTESMLILPTEEWEYAKASVAECGYIIKHNGTYYLIYAGGNYNSTYGVGYATSNSIYGPYTKYAYNPIMWSNDQAFGNGAASTFVSPDNTEHFIIYLRNNGHTVTRPLNTCIDRIRFVPNPFGGPDILEIAGATVTPQKLPSGIGSINSFDYQMARWHW